MPHADTAQPARAERADDVIAPTSVQALNATLDHEATLKTGDALPPLWHWIFFRPTVRQSLIAIDGHPKKGGFLPDLGLPRRMWAGGRLRFLTPLRVGEAISRESRVIDVSQKEGRSGKLGFVTVKHEICSGATLAIEEEQDIVFREPPVPGAQLPTPSAARTDELWHRAVRPDEVLLFRYSALIFFSHRIHYDKPYAVEVEGYPDLVVHGPLIATLLVDLLRRFAPEATVQTFSFKAIRPSFMDNALHLCARPADDGKSIDLWSRDHEGWLTMSARATLA